jgi:hypothetical protein
MRYKKCNQCYWYNQCGKNKICKDFDSLHEGGAYINKRKFRNEYMEYIGEFE